MNADEIERLCQRCINLEVWNADLMRRIERKQRDQSKKLAELARRRTALQERRAKTEELVDQHDEMFNYFERQMTRLEEHPAYVAFVNRTSTEEAKRSSGDASA